MNRREFVTLATAAPFGLRGALLAQIVPSPAALVTCDSESRLAVVELGSYRVRGSIPTLPDPRSIERVGSRAVVCHTSVGAVSVVAGSRVVHVIHGLVEPRYVAAHPDGVHAFITDSGRSGVVLVDVVRGRVLGRVRLPGWARHITADPSGSRLWVGLGSSSEQIAVVDTRALRHVATLSPAFAMHDVGRAADGRLWVTAGLASSIAVGGSRLPADAAPQHVTFGPSTAYVTSGDAGLLRVLEPDGTARRTTRVPVGSYNVQYGSGRVLTPSLAHGTLTVLDSQGTRQAQVSVADSCHDACFWRL